MKNETNKTYPSAAIDILMFWQLV